MPRRFGFGLGFSLSRLSGGLLEPSGFVAKLTSYTLGNFTLDGSDVTQWNDESNNANNVTQAVTANKFTLVQDANPFNNVVRSDATDDNMTPLPTTTGDFAMQFKKQANNLDPNLPNDFAPSAMTTTGAGSVYTSDGSFSLTALKASGMSFSMFIDTNTATNLGYLANFRGDSTSGIPQELALKAQNGNKLTLEGYNGSSFVTLETSTLVNDLGLAHVGFTMSAGGSSVKIYVDGSELGTVDFSSLQTDTASALAISEGQQGNLYSPTDGLRAMPRVQNREITASEMLYLSQNPTACYADLDNTSGLKDATIYAPNLMTFNGRTEASALVDNSPSGITTIEAGSLTYEPTGALIVSDGGTQYNTAFASLNGSSQYFDAGNPTELQFGGTASISMEAWIYADSLGNGTFRNIIRQDGGYYWRIGDNNRMFCKMYSSNDLTSSNTFPTDTWSHVVVTYDGTNIKYYLNGAIDTTIASTGNMPTVSAITAIGARSDGLELFEGYVASPKVFNRALNATEITALYNNGKVLTYGDIATSITNDCVYAPRLSNWNGNAGSELIDQSTSGITTTNVGSTPFVSELAVECTEIKTPKVLFSSSTTSAEARINTSNQFEVVSDAGTVFTFNAIKTDAQQETNIINRVGDSLELFDSVGYKEFLDATGETFTFDRVSDTANASDSDWQEIRVYDNALTQEQVDYFYYLRNASNEILTPPLLPDKGSEFIFTVKTDNAGGVSNNDQMKIGTIATGVYDCTVDWGDGSSDVITTWDDPAWTHTYSVAGTYVITISGTSFTYPYFYLGDDTKVLNVSKWGFTDYGTTALTSFRGCSNLTLSASDVPDTSSVTNMSTTWYGCSSLTSFPLINTSSATTISNAWRDCSSLTSFPLIDTSSVTNISTAWQNCSSLTSFPLINTSSVTNMQYTWQSCSNLTSFPLIDTSSVTTIRESWYNCSSLTSFPLINTSSVTDMYRAWRNCSSLTSFPLINTSSVTAMQTTWAFCSSLTDFPLIDVSSCTDFTSTWFDCALNSASIDNIMQALVNGNQNNLSTDISGGTNLGFASWSAGAVANYNTLISRGWTITTNP